MSTVQARKVITLYFTPSTASGNIEFKNVPFKPDEMVVRSVVYSGGTAATDINPASFWLELVNDHVCQFTAGCNFAPLTTFIVNRDVNASWRYNFFANTSGTEATTNDGRLMVGLEFIKYEDKK